MSTSVGVLIVYAALVVWGILGVDALRRGSYRMFLTFGIGLMLALNVGYFINGAPAAIAFFIGIYDVVDNLNLSSEGAAAMAACPNNDCSVWSQYSLHPRWGVAFHDRFLNGPDLRRNLLYGHIFFNTVAFVLMHVQLWRPGSESAWKRLHRLLGRVTFGALTVGVACACLLATEHGAVADYGGLMSQLGFYFMAACVYGCAIMSVVAIRQGDVARHGVWTLRFMGSMWGSYWLFRVVLFVIDPLLRDTNTLAILLVIWGSAPLGIAVAEVWRRSRTHREPESLAAK